MITASKSSDKAISRILSSLCDMGMLNSAASGISRLWFPFCTLYSRTCLDEHTATQPDGETDVATSYGLDRNLWPGLCKRVSACEANEAGNKGKFSTAKEKRRVEGCEELLEIDIIDERKTRMP